LHKRAADWGTDEVNRALVEAWHALRQRVSNPAAPLLQVRRHAAGRAVQQAYAQLVRGDVDPALGHVLSLA
jgi:hypothetical protein